MTKKWTPGKTKKLVKKAVTAVATGNFTELDKVVDDPEIGQKISAGKIRTSPAEKEAKLIILQRMMFRKMPLAEMCKQLNLGDRQLRRLQAELKSRTLSEVKGMNFPQFVGETLNFYDEIRTMALVISSNPKIEDHRIKLQAMNQALGAEDSKHKFLSLCGVYKSSTAEQFAKNLISETTNTSRGGADVEGVLSTFAHTLMKQGVMLNRSGKFEPEEAEVLEIAYEELPLDATE